jgi:putative endopeptidase
VVSVEANIVEGYALNTEALFRRHLRIAFGFLPHVDQDYQVTVDPHAPARWRVIGPLSNLPEFAQAFGCKAGDVMVRADSLRTEIW